MNEDELIEVLDKIVTAMLIMVVVIFIALVVFVWRVMAWQNGA